MKRAIIADARKCCFPPIIDARARVLILGTLPGEESLRLQQYYGHPRNAFWNVIAHALGEKPASDYDKRVAMLLRHRLALWDVLSSADRTGSLDAAIRNPAPNDFAALFAARPRLRAMAFNGQTAKTLFRRHIISSAHQTAAEFLLPSTSPAYTMPVEEKAKRWRDALQAALAL